MKCPKCEKEIEDLIHWQKIDSRSYCTLDGEVLEYHSQEEYYDNAIDLEYLCPLCSERLFTKDEDALKFLKGVNNGDT